MPKNTALPKEVTKYKETALFWNNAWEEVGLFETLPEKVQAELYDFEKLISSWSKIAFAITGGKLSYPNYEPDVLVTEYEDFVTEQINEGVQEELTQAHQDTEKAVKAERVRVMKEIVLEANTRHKELYDQYHSKPGRLSPDRYSDDYLGGKVREATLNARYYIDKFEQLAPSEQRSEEHENN